MEKRTILNKTKHSIEYIAKYKSGETGTYTCSPEDWETYLLKTKLIEAGANENDVEELYSQGYSAGRDAADWDAAENEGW